MKKVFTTLMLCLLSTMSIAQTTVSTSTALPYDTKEAVASGNNCSSTSTISFNVPASANGQALTEIELTFRKHGSRSGMSFALMSFYIKDNLGVCHGFYTNGGISNSITGDYVATFKSLNHSTCLNQPNTANFGLGDNPNPNTNSNYGIMASAVNFPSHTNVNGTWTIHFDESTSNEPLVIAATLEFGNQLPSQALPPLSGDNCISPIVWSGQPICANTTGASPDNNTPGNALSGLGNSYSYSNMNCTWMLTLENDIWIEFSVNSTGLTCINLSGLDGAVQSIVVTDTNNDGDNNPCTGTSYTSSQTDPNWEVISCPSPAIYSNNGTQTFQNHCFTGVVGETYYLVVDGTGGALSPFYIDGTNGAFTPLPIELSYFDGKAFDDYNLLTWVTISERNNSHFEIEMSLDGKQFKNIAKLQGKGTTTEISYYSFKHDNPPSSAYYRLKQVDYDGEYKYASVVFVRNISNADFEIYPQPAGDFLNVSYETKNSNTALVIYNLSGTVVRQEILEQNLFEHVIDMDNIQQGAYIIELSNENFIARKQFMKQ